MGSLRKYVFIKFSQGLSVGTAGCFPAPRGPFSGSPGRPGRPGARFPGGRFSAPRGLFSGSSGRPGRPGVYFPAPPWLVGPGFALIRFSKNQKRDL